MSIVVDLYHGTSTYFAGALLTGSSASPLHAARALKCAAALREAIISVTGSEFAADGFYPAGSRAATWAPVALRAAAEQRQDTLMDYGDFYATLSLRIAASYAANNPHGSELLHAIKVTFEALRSGGHPSGYTIAAGYPTIEQIVNQTHRPVVIRLAAVPIELLTNENGSAFTERHLEKFRTYDSLDCRMPGSVRVRGPIGSLIVGGFSLSLREGEHAFGAIQDEDITLRQLDLDDLKAYCGMTT